MSRAEIVKQDTRVEGQLWVGALPDLLTNPYKEASGAAPKHTVPRERTVDN